MSQDKELVWLTDERTFGWLLQMGAYYSRVEYTWGGMTYEVLIENTDFILMEDEGIDYESQ